MSADPAHVNVHEDKTRLSRIIERVERGEEVIIDRAGTPVAALDGLTLVTRDADSQRYEVDLLIARGPSRARMLATAHSSQVPHRVTQQARPATR